MRRPLIAAAATAILLAASFVTAGAQTRPIETDELLRQNLIGQVYFAWQQMKFQQLEEWATSVRGKEARMKGGSHTLASFYGGFAHMYSRDNPRKNELLTRSWNAVLQEWLKAHPTSPTPLLAHATVLYNNAWLVRGDGYADKVWKDDWQLFRTALEDLRDHLQRARPVAEADPHWHDLNAKAEFLLDGNHAKLMERLRAGLARFPDYLPLYEIGGRYLTPKWGGSAKLYDAWVDEAVRRTRPSEGTGMRVRIYQASGGGPAMQMDLGDPRVWAMLKVSIADIVTRYPEASTTQHLMPLACRAGDATEVRRLWIELVVQAGRPHDTDIDPRSYCRWDSRSPVGRQPPHKKEPTPKGI